MKNFFKKQKPSFTQSKNPGKGNDNLWAAIRRLNAQVDALSAKLNIVMTMAMRTEKKVYREKEPIAPSDGQPEKELSPSLFG
ncbi:hypothetical protein ES703_109550 [subsurface metagenome]